MPGFRLRNSDGDYGDVYSLAEMEHANESDPDVVEWCRNAKPGDSKQFGGGAFALSVVSCVETKEERMKRMGF